MGGHNTGNGAKDLALGGILQMLEAASLGMPLEVWKTRMGRFRNENTIQAFQNVYRNGGIPAFYQGLMPKMIESGSKGAVLLFAKDAARTSAINAGLSHTQAGFVGGALGGIAQVSVMGPCTFLVTAMVTQSAESKRSMTNIISQTWKSKGFKGFYPGGTAIAARQASNWAGRQGFTDLVRGIMFSTFQKKEDGDILRSDLNIYSGMIGGALACWNHPFEVARIEMQARANQNQTNINMLGVFRMVYKEHGVSGLFKGVIPRIGLGIWQTLFMVTFAQMAKDAL